MSRIQLFPKLALCIVLTGSIALEAQTQTNAPTTLPTVTVLGTNDDGLAENRPLGANQQPEWTARRRFTTTRVYVQPPWQLETEIGLDTTFPRTDRPKHLLQEEIELGLPHRFQLDFENHDQNFFEGDDVTRKWHLDSRSVELGYAFADWGRIPLNPTLKGEWKFNHDAADAFEVQLLLGEELGARWHWGLNLFYEQQIGDDHVREFAMSQALSYTLIDQKLSVGAEMKFSSESDKDTRFDPENSFVMGPSLQWRPTARTHLDVAPLFGAGPDSPHVELFVFFGIDFGPVVHEKEGIVPASLRGK